MDFSQPSDSIVTNKTTAEEKRLIEIRNQVTLLEGESVRLRDLIQAEKYTVNELVKQKAELESQIPVLADKKAELEQVIEKLTGLMDLLDEKKKILHIETSKEVETANKVIEQANKAKEDMLEERATLENEKADLAKAQESLHEQAAVLAEKQAKLRELIS